MEIHFRNLRTRIVQNMNIFHKVHDTLHILLTGANLFLNFENYFEFLENLFNKKKLVSHLS